VNASLALNYFNENSSCFHRNFFFKVCDIKGMARDGYYLIHIETL